jgi:hypothetical protein
MWNFSYSPYYIILMMINLILIGISIVLSITNLIRLIKYKLRAALFLIIAIIPFVDTWTQFHDKTFEMFKSNKEFEAISNGPTSSIQIILRHDNSFEYKEQSPFGAKIFKGEYELLDDSLSIRFRNKTPSFVNQSMISGKIGNDYIKTKDDKALCLKLINKKE